MITAKRGPSAIGTAIGSIVLIALIGPAFAPARVTTVNGGYTAIVLFCSRTIKDEAKYTAAFDALSDYTMASDPHAKAMFSFIDKTKSKTALQFWWFDNEAAFKPELMSALGGEYAGTKDTDYCQVYGGWSEQLKATASAMMGVHYAFVPMNGGFTRLPSEMPKDILTEPIIWVSRRQISDMAMYVKGFKHASQAMFDAAPGLLSTLNFVAEDDPNIIWDLRVMTDWQTGFVDHFSPATAPIIMGEMAPYIASWNFPYAVGFCTKAVQEKLIAANPGNAVYTYYNIDDGSMIGSVDFAK
jgi:hypothetical protein